MRVLWVTLLLFSFSVIFAWHPASGSDVTLGFIGDEASFESHNKAALEWARAEFSTTVLAPSDLPNEDLTRYAVLWWQDGETDPTPLLTNEVIQALTEYIEAGGGLLLSAAAEKLATPLGIESGVPRIYGPGGDNHAAGVRIREDTLEHPVWEGFNRQVGEEIQVTSVGFPKSSDYWSRQYVEAVTVGDCWETGADWTDEVGAFVEWQSGNGVVFGMGWRLPHWTDDNQDLATLQQLTANVILYLVSKSAFFPVEPQDKLAVTWADVKAGK